MNSNPNELVWQRRYEENDTPWDKGTPAPALEHFLLKKPISGRVLVPGCGRGHEVRLLGQQPNCTVVGMDIASAAIAEAKNLSLPSGTNKAVSFIQGDFFQPPSDCIESFDWLVEHTCFCAIEPRLRADYVHAAASVLQRDGKIFGIFYLNPEAEFGPPFGITKNELSELFHPYFNLLDEWIPEAAFPGRENRELIRILQKKPSTSL